MAQKPTIFINPKFKNAHINPNFLKSSNHIHINPKFVQRLTDLPAPQPAIQPPQPSEPTIKVCNPIIRNTRRTLIRAVASRPNVSSTISPSRGQFQEKSFAQPQHQLIKISKNKLVTAAHLMKCQQKENELIKQTTESLIKSKKLHRKSDMKESIYKLDRRQNELTKKKKRIVSTYSIRRVDTISPQKVIVPERSLLKTGQSNKRLMMVNINGVLYKSTSNKLEKTASQSSNLSPSEKLLIIRGAKFILDSSGTKLRRDSEGSVKLSRIDIGGLTYKESQSGSFERDNSHQIRSHLSIAKTKSISVLARNVLQKTNIVCPIYRRLGKCLAYANGRCHKVHDQRYVIVCPSYLKGSCQNDKCLLSHNANLHKMPVCKFFLQGLCQKQRECFYLHKKLSDDAKFCAEFIKGYCPLADKCNFLHDFPASDKKSSSYSLIRKKPKKERYRKPAEAASSLSNRYEAEASASSSAIPQRKKLGKLPSYIPL